MDSGPCIGIVLLILLSAFFSGSEIAFASVNKVRLKKSAQEGNPYAKQALYISDHFDDALSTILIGNNLVNIAASAVSTVIAVGLMGESGALVATLAMTVIILTFGEITPKIIAKQQCNKYVLIAAYPLRLLMVVLRPVISVVLLVVSMASKLWEKDAEKEPSVTEEELVSIIESIEDEGVIDKDRSDLLQSALEFSDISVQEILTPRTDMLAIDNVIGILHLGKFLKNLTDMEQVDIRSLLIDVCFVHKTMKLPAVFAELKRRRLQMAIVTDEYGGTMGCITMEDVLEQLVGEIWDETDEVVNEFVGIGKNLFEVDGDLNIRDFLEYTDTDDRDFESEYSTVGGWTIEMLNGVPNVGDWFRYKNLTVKVVELDGLRVTKLHVEIGQK